MIAAAHQTMLAPQEAPLPYDAEVEYLESDGTQYVDTGIVPESGTSFEAEYIQTTMPYQFAPIAYCGNAYNSSDTFGSAVNNAIGINNYFGTAFNLHVGDYKIALGQRILFAFRRSGSSIVASNITTGVTDTASFGGATYTKGSRSLYVLNGNAGTADLAHPACMKLYYFKLYNNGVLARDFQPVRVGSTGYLYDRVSGTLFGNAGTGAFTIGPDK